MNNKMLIGIDLDGTTLMSWDGKINEKNKRIDRIHPKNKEVIKKLIDLGHVIVICTGRNWTEAKEIYNELELNSFIVNSAGGHIHNPNDENFKDVLTGIPNDIFKEIINDEFISPKILSWCVDNVNKTFMKTFVQTEFNKKGKIFWDVQDFNGEFNFDPQSSIIFLNNDQEEITKTIQYLRKKWGNIVHFAKWGNSMNNGKYNGIELNPASSSKGKAMLKIAKILNISADNTIGIGDGENDYELIKLVKHGVVMIQGENYIKEHAKYITKFDNDNGGVGYFLEEFFSLN